MRVRECERQHSPNELKPCILAGSLRETLGKLRACILRLLRKNSRMLANVASISSMNRLKLLVLALIRSAGGFALARKLTRNRLRILCYHGFATGDEYENAPYMFMRGETFRRRMQLLHRLRIPVIGLDEAVRRLHNGDIRNAETVITLDDGWASNLTVGLPTLEAHGYPATVYVTTDHLSAGSEAFNVILFYLVHKSRRRTLTLVDIHPEIDGQYLLEKDPEEAVLALISAAERAFPLKRRQEALRHIADALGVDLREVLTDERFRFMDGAELQEMHRRGVDIQLHTHSHRLPSDSFEEMSEEIEQNRRVVKELLGKDANHLCYPSGRYSINHTNWLPKLGIISATTCDSGLNRTTTSPMLLHRYLDNETATDLEFEAEIVGLRDLLRNFRSVIRQILPGRRNGRGTAR
jgi:peptidoglycan/xylan/chitin deacetylase (PgdA/CDA1 family)